MVLPAVQSGQRRMSREEVIDALSQKREALDKEVEDFKRLKDQEFQRFEEELDRQAENTENRVDHDDIDISTKEEELGMRAKDNKSRSQSKDIGASQKEETTASAESKTDQSSAPNTSGVDTGTSAAPKMEADLVVAPAKERSGEGEASIPAQSDGGLPHESVSARSPEARKTDTKERQGKEVDNGGNERVHSADKEQKEAGIHQARPSDSKASKAGRSKKRHQDSLMKVNGGQHPINKEDRELELRALFTPAYLPLLEGPSHRQYLSDGDLSGADSKSSHQNSKHSRHHSDSSKLSSSLTTLPSLSNNNTEASSTSNSQPRLGIAERRSSSSPTGTGRTLRSSLRSPEQAQRERKRVLFQIDNRVISPSTSPAATRSLGPQTKKGQRTPPIPFSGLKDFPFPEMKDFEPATPAKPPTKPSHISIAGASSVMPPSTVSPTRFPRSYKDLVEPIVVTPPDEVRLQDMRIETSDPMFDLEDQENSGNDAPLFGEGGWGPGGRVGERPEGAGATEAEIAADMAASPHAGSLPIEIKFSGRRAS